MSVTRSRFASVASSFRSASLRLRLEFRDAGRFLENRAPVLRLRAEDQVDLPLLHDRVGAAADARIHEKIVDVAQPARSFVQQILGSAVAENTPRDADFVPFHAEFLFTFGEGHRHFCHAESLPGVSSGKNHVGHFASAQRLGRLLAKDPADRIEDVRFAASIRADDGSDAFVKIQDGFRCERFETEEFERLKIHREEVRTARNYSDEQLGASTICCGW